MKKKLENKNEIQFLVETFYKKAQVDNIIGHFFTELTDFSFDVHIPIMVNFWDGILFGTNNYNGNPMSKHIGLDKKYPLQKEHFERWQKLFFETLDIYFEGEKVDEIKNRVINIGNLILYKVQASRQNNY